MSKKILITGATGQLGTNILALTNYNYNYIPTSLSKRNDFVHLDITNSNLVADVLYKYNPDVIINCAAYTNVDNAYINKKSCHDVNVNGLINLSRFSKKNVKIVHISSDYVFDGATETMYKEDDLTYPVNYYGKTKLEAENYLIGADKNDFLIFRPNVIYSSCGDNFFTFVYNSIKKYKTINIVNDQRSNPVYAGNFAKIILESVLMNLSGLYHYGSTDTMTRYDFAIKVANYFDLNTSFINSVLTTDLNQKEKRPLNTSLDCSKIKSHLSCNTYSTEESFRYIF